jgi:hypothetical protein
VGDALAGLSNTWGVGATRVRFKDTRAKALKLERLALAKAARAVLLLLQLALRHLRQRGADRVAVGGLRRHARQAPHVTFLLLTKRAPNRSRHSVAAAKQLLGPAFVFVSIEPMMEQISLLGRFIKKAWTAGVDWVICGFESGSHARLPEPIWARILRDECAEADVPFHFKQWGSWDADVRRYTGMDGKMPMPRLKVGVKASGRLLDGVLHDARPTIGPERFAFRDERGLRKSINRPR